MSSLALEYSEVIVKARPQRRKAQTVAPDPENWVDEHGDYLFGYALLRVRDRELAEELVQETFLAALKARHNFAGQSSEKTWLVGILKHKIIDHFRRVSREHSVADFEANAREEDLFRQTGEWVDHWKPESAPKEWANDPSRLLEQKEFWEIFKRCLAELPPRLAQAFTLREIDGFSSEEICEILNISANNLWVMLHRARALLRRSMEVNWLAS